MTSHSSSSKTVDLGHRWPPNSSVCLNYQQNPNSVPCQPIKDHASGVNGGVDSFEPSHKRQKLETRSNSLAVTAVKDLEDSFVRRINTRASVEHSMESLTVKEDLARANDLRSGLTSDQTLAASQTHSFPLLPLRPCIQSYKHTKVGDKFAIERAAVKHVVQVKPYMPGPPSLAPQYPRGGVADYYPWTGNHPEDVLNELTTKQGFYDKGTHNETSTARPSVWSSLKHKSGLQILSSLLVAALDQRQIQGTITANCTFKPPPRVTLTDTKREAWLRDLANPAIALRRLSRTIPHGIRGKVLLDHCLAKNIPTARAVWLAKCVGANEIRAFKRKGASGAFAIGGETKWIRDWTTNVESFVESIVGDCGTPLWRERISYSLRLVSHLFSEHLLDQDQYLDWVVASLQSSDLHDVLVWLLVVQIYWKEILQYRDRGRRLAEGLLDQLWKAFLPPNQDAFAEVTRQLIPLLQSFMVSAPLCFLLRSWSKYETILRKCLQDSDDVVLFQLEDLSRRNSRLKRPSVDQRNFSKQSHQQRLIALLDRVPIEIEIGQIADACTEVIHHHDLLIATCLDWATNIYRNGHARIYLVVRLLRHWANIDIELDRSILGYLSTDSYVPQQQKVNIYRLIAELIHSRHFSVAKYLQWLIARGRLAEYRNTDRIGPCDVHLLFELPLHGLPSHVLNLRRLLLSSVGASTAKEDTAIAATKAKVAMQIQDFFPASQIPQHQELQPCDSYRLSLTVRSDVGRWIRHVVASRFQEHGVGSRLNSRNFDTSFIPINPEQFRSVRSVLEILEDFSVLADVIKLCCSSSDVKILTAAADTVNHHIDVFMAIGAVDDLFKSLYHRYEDTCNQKIFERLLVESLVDLGKHLPESIEEVRKLRRVLLHPEHEFSIAACSPISDHMTEGLQSAESAFTDEVEQVLTSGTSMDKQTLKQMFKKITTWLELAWAGSCQCSLISFAELLRRLRNFGSALFEELLCDWLDHLLLFKHRPNIARILPPFICTATLTLKTVLDRMVILLANAAATGHVAALGLDGLELLLVTDLDLHQLAINRQYRLYNQQIHIIKEDSSLTIPILRATIEACSDKENPICERARALIKHPGTMTIIKGLLQQYCRMPDAVSQAIGAGLLKTHAIQVINGLLYPSSESSVQNPGFHDQILEVLDHVNDFNVPLCQLKLRAILAVAAQSSFDATNTLVTIVVERAKASTDTFATIWAALISGLPSKQALQIRQRVENEILSAISKDTASMTDNGKGMLEALIALADASSVGMSDSGVPLVVMQVTERFSSMLASPTMVRELPQETKYSLRKDATDFLDFSNLYIDTLLRLLIVHQAAVHCARLSEGSLIQLLVTLSLLLTHQSCDTCPKISERVLDVLALFTESLSDEIRFQCVRVLRDQHRTRDPRLLFLFGYSENTEGEWLQLITNPLSAVGAKPDGATESMQPFPVRKWEMMQDTTPLVTENDTSLSLTLFGARTTVL